MKLEMTSLIRQLSDALDFVEMTLFGISTKHGKRLSLLVSNMAMFSELSEKEIITLSMLAPLHDNALTEYIASELNGDRENLYKHCEIGQKNVENLFFPSSVKDIILYHHEFPDRSGCFKKREGEISLEAEILSLADYIDLHFGLGNLPEREISFVTNFVKANKGKLFFSRAADAFVKVFDAKLLKKMSNQNIDNSFNETSNDFYWYADLDNRHLLNLANFIMGIVDYKSKFTLKHSSQIANRMLIMAKHYKYDADLSVKLYLAAAFHDLGKLPVPLNILNKEGMLTNAELQIAKSHALWTHKLLKEVRGFEEICYIASHHHEKLDGSGYPFGKKAGELNFFARLLAALDIYQAVSEERPYHPQRSHRETMDIMYCMVRKNQLDAQIVKDIDTVLQPFHSGKAAHIPSPAELKPFISY